MQLSEVQREIIEEELEEIRQVWKEQERKKEALGYKSRFKDRDDYLILSSALIRERERIKKTIQRLDEELRSEEDERSKDLH